MAPWCYSWMEKERRILSLSSFVIYTSISSRMQVSWPKKEVIWVAKVLLRYWEEENRELTRRMKHEYEKTSLVFSLSDTYSFCSLPAWLLHYLGLLHVFSHTFPHHIKPPLLPSSISYSSVWVKAEVIVQIICFWKQFCTPSENFYHIFFFPYTITYSDWSRPWEI